MAWGSQTGSGPNGQPISPGKPLLDSNPKRKVTIHESPLMGKRRLEYIGKRGRRNTPPPHGEKFQIIVADTGRALRKREFHIPLCKCRLSLVTPFHRVRTEGKRQFMTENSEQTPP